MKFMKKYRKRGMAAAIAAVSLITSLLVPQFSAVAATSERVNLLIAPKTIIGDSKGDYVGWTEFSSDTVGEIEAGDISGAWYMQKIGNTGRDWEDYAVYNNQNSNDISGFLWEAAYLKDPGISLKMGVDNTFRHRATSESLKADNGKTKHDCAFVRKTIDQTLVTHENCEACVTEQGKYDWSMMPAKMINEETGKKEEDFFFYFEDNDTAGLFLNGVVDEVVDRTSKIKEQYYTGFVLYLNESPESASYKNERQMKSGIYYCINTNFSTTSYRNGGYKKASDVKSGKSGVYQLKTFSDALEEQGLVTFGVEKGEEGRDSNKADDNYTDVSFKSKLKNGKVTVTATVKNNKTGVDTSLSFTGDADYYRSEGSIGFFSYSQPCATFAEIRVSGIPPEYTITYDADGGKFADGTTKDIVQPVKLYDFEYVDTTEYYYPIPVGTLEGGTVTRTGYHIKDDHNTPSKSRGWYYEVFDKKKEKELLSTMYYTDYFHESITVKPAWEVNAGTVKYNGNGGTLIDSTNKPKNTTIKYTTEKVNLRNAEDYWERTGYYIPAATAWHVGSKTSETIITESKDSTEAATTLKEELELDKKHDTSVTLYANWNPYKLTVKYNTNGGTGTFSNETMYYDDASKPKTYGLTSTVPTRDGYTFLGWSTKQTAAASDTIFTGSTAKKTAQAWASALDTSIDTSNKTVTLYAQWKANTYTIRFHPNGGEGHMDDIKPVFFDTSVELPKCNYTKENEYGISAFKGWNTIAETGSILYQNKAIVINLAEEQDEVVTLYAIWDDCPGIKSHDLYYTLEQAKSGYITEDELLNQAEAFDLEDNVIPPGTHETNAFRVIDYQESDFTQFQNSGSVSETYQVIDSYGNIYREQIIVYIVDTVPSVIHTATDNLDKEGTTRFIDEKYFNLSYEQGGVENNSVWLLDAEYRQVLMKAFENIKNNTPEDEYEFTHKEILEMKEYVKRNGIGNTKSLDGLEKFWEKFLKNK